MTNSHLRLSNFYSKLEILADKVLERLHEEMQCTTASLQIIRGKQRFFAGVYGFSRDNNSCLLRDIENDKLINSIVTTKMIRILSDVKDEGCLNVKETPNVNSWICAPLIFNNDVIGLLTIDHSEPNFYTEKDREKVEKFSRDTASEVRQSYFFQESERRIYQLETLIKVGNELSSGIDRDEDQLFELVEKRSREALGINNITISLLDADKIRFVRASRNGEIVDTNGAGWEALSKNGGKGKTKYIIDNCTSLVLYLYSPDENGKKNALRSENGDFFGFSSDPNGENEDAVPYCWIGVPIKLGKKILGIINAFSFDHDLHKIYDKDILEALANKTAIALQNIRLHKRKKSINLFQSQYCQRD